MKHVRVGSRNVLSADDKIVFAQHAERAALDRRIFSYIFLRPDLDGYDVV
jgi:hypothetical protein